MKKPGLLGILILTIVFAVGLSFAQQTEPDYRISKVTVSSGRGALSSGIFSSIEATNGENTLMFEVSGDFVQAMYGYQSGPFFLAGSAGYFQNAPWIGPFITIQPFGFLTLTSWNGISAGQAKDPQAKIMYSFSFSSVKVDIGPVYVCYSLLSFQKDLPNNLLGAGINIPFGSKINCSVGGDYSVRDKEPLFSAALSYKF